jgi:PX domain
MESEFRKENIKISITVPEKDVYLVSGEDKDGKFEVQRRYKDLICLRNTLVKEWPGCYIPFIPKSIVTPI